jgi:hypothetical protein
LKVGRHAFSVYSVEEIYECSAEVVVCRCALRGVQQGPLRVYFNVMIGSVMLIIALIGYWLYRQDAPPARRRA